MCAPIIRFCFVLLLVASQLAVFAGDRISVGLFNGAHHVRATVTCKLGSFDVYGGDEILFRIGPGQQCEISTVSGALNIYFNQKTTTQQKSIRLVPQQPDAQMHIQPVGAKTNQRRYGQEMSVMAYSGRVQFVNHLELEDYVAGVIEAETGSNQTTEFYKVQAVISRTYAMKNLHKHKADGFNICDAVHCQVYHGIPLHEPKTFEAAQSTRDLVLVDHQINLIDATFHSNCGGQTYRANEVWSKDIPHLQNVSDDYCSKMPHSFWKKTIARKEWDRFIANQRDPLSSTDSTEYLLKSHKPQYVVDSTLSISRVEMRESFKLKSVKFNVEIGIDSVRFFGQGYGHGVGLCQEGAMARANEGIRYQDIIHAYYREVHLVPRYMIWFFKDEESPSGEVSQSTP
jgi:stage II sporulation protein D